MQRQVFEMGDRTFDHVADLVDRGIKLFLPVEELSAGWLAKRGGDTGPDVTLIADRVVIAEDFAKAGLMHGLRIAMISSRSLIALEIVG